MNDPETDFVIKDKLDKLFTTCINNTGVYRDYTDEELFQATFIFTELFIARMHKQHKDKVDFEGLCKLAEHAGESVRQTVLLFTGVDLQKIKK